MNSKIPTADRHVFILVYNTKLIDDTRRRMNEWITFRAENRTQFYDVCMQDFGEETYHIAVT
jgi:hypothetical protein